ncbi:MAG: type II toxin-antitoxin system antitoxin SocA domain-containing protein, partial [Flammeovirgaceae bacterium]
EMIEHEVRKEKFDIVYHYYLCEDSGEKFEDERLMQLNLNQVYNQFRKMHNLPFPEEIISLREQYGLSASKMSEVLGFGINVYRSYENGEIPSSSNARLIQLAGDPKEFKRLVDLSNDLSDKERERVMIRIEDLLLEKEFNNFDVQKYLMGKRLADEETGYRIPNLEKFTEMVVFFTQELQPYKTRLNKLLFYADFSHFKNYGISISGCRYRAIDKGPVPFNYGSLFEFAANNDFVDILQSEETDGRMREKFVTHGNRLFNEKLFAKEEIETIQRVSKKFAKTYSKDIIELSHEEDGWKENFRDGKKIISYIDAFKLKNMPV